MQTSQYNTKAKPISYRNCLLDSRAEFKYMLLIEDNCRFLREYITIWYDPRTNLPVRNQPVTYLPIDCCKYTPDFLVRDKISNKALLVEVKPDSYTDDLYLEKRKYLVEEYIRQQRLDWEYRLIYDDEIKLTQPQWATFNNVTKNQRGFEMLRQMERRDKRYNSCGVRYFKHIPAMQPDEELSREQYVHFVYAGVGRAVPQ